MNHRGFYKHAAPTVLAFNRLDHHLSFVQLDHDVVVRCRRISYDKALGEMNRRACRNGSLRATAGRWLPQWPRRWRTIARTVVTEPAHRSRAPTRERTTGASRYR